MIPETNGVDESGVGLAGTADQACSLEAIAEQLAREFEAPVGVFDPRGCSWCTTKGALESQFPLVDERFERISRSSELGLGKAVLWRFPEDRGRVWLVMPLADARGGGHVVWAGFHDPADPSRTNPAVDEDTRDLTREQIQWGPACPDPRAASLGPTGGQPAAQGAGETDRSRLSIHLER